MILHQLLHAVLWSFSSSTPTDAGIALLVIQTRAPNQERGDLFNTQAGWPLPSEMLVLAAIFVLSLRLYTWLRARAAQPLQRSPNCSTDAALLT